MNAPEESSRSGLLEGAEVEGTAMATSADAPLVDGPSEEDLIALPLFLDDSARDEPFGMLSDAEPFDGEETFVLSLDGLLPDSAGDIVLNVEPGMQVALGEGTEVAEVGQVDNYVTAAGIDVSGLSYAVLSNGVTLFHDGALQILETTAAVAAV